MYKKKVIRLQKISGCHESQGQSPVETGSNTVFNINSYQNHFNEISGFINQNQNRNRNL